MFEAFYALEWALQSWHYAASPNGSNSNARATVTFVARVQDRTKLSFVISNMNSLPLRRSACDRVDHLVEFAFHFCFEVCLDLVNLSELGERPASIRACMIHGRDPVRLHGGLLLLRV